MNAAITIKRLRACPMLVIRPFKRGLAKTK